MELGLSSFTYGWAVSQGKINLATLIKRTQDFGLRRLQLGDNWPAEKLTPSEIRCMASSDLTFELGARCLTVERATRYIELCQSTNSPLLRFVIDGPNYEPAESEVIEILTKLLGRLVEANVVLGMENHDRWKSQSYRRIVEAVDHPCVGICLDTANSLGAGEGLAEVWGELAPYCVNLHVKDFAIHRLPHLMGFQVEGRPAGQGMLDIPALLATLARHQRCDSATLELWTVSEPDSDQTITKEILWAEQSVQFLKPLFC